MTVVVKRRQRGVWPGVWSPERVIVRVAEVFRSAEGNRSVTALGREQTGPRCPSPYGRTPQSGRDRSGLKSAPQPVMHGLEQSAKAIVAANKGRPAEQRERRALPKRKRKPPTHQAQSWARVSQGIDHLRPYVQRKPARGHRHAILSSTAISPEGDIIAWLSGSGEAYLTRNLDYDTFFGAQRQH